VALEFRFPDVGEGIDAGELVEWHVSEGQSVREDDPMADVQTDKAIVTIPCPTTGVVLELRINEGEMVGVGEVMAVFEPHGASAAAPQPAFAAPLAAPARPQASPAVRKRAADLGLDLAQVQGSGPQGRIELADLEPASGDGGGDAAASPRGRVVPLRGVRRTIARAMTESWQTIPHIIDYREADATGLLQWRQSLRDQADDEPLRGALTLTPLLVAIAVEALRKHPYVNASVDLEREEITLHDEYNIGIATATDDGLLVPVLRHADARNVHELALEADALVRSARERRLRPDQLSGGTFTVNNYGSLGVWLGTPIIKPGEVANLGLGRVQERPVAVDGQVVVRPIVALSVSGDHRVLDGHTLGAFVSDVVALIEDPAPLAGSSE
jgi:pyruvate dehydrogenase E2 component (dihydrolipoamide acetyltransferase)